LVTKELFCFPGRDCRCFVSWFLFSLSPQSSGISICYWLEQVGNYYRRQKNQSLIDLFFDLSLGLPEARGTLSFTKEHDYFNVNMIIEGRWLNFSRPISSIIKF